jgi:hypothetical protein
MYEETGEERMQNQIRKSIGTAALAVAAAAYSTAGGHAQPQADAKAAAVIAEARKALGGEQNLAAVKALSLRADYRRELSAGAGGGATTFVMVGAGGSATGGSQATGKIEIDVELPDKYLKSDVGSSGLTMTRTDGFEGARPFLEVVPGMPGMRIQVDNPAGDPARATSALKRGQGDLARLMLGLVAGTQPGFAVTFAYGGQAESPDGKADIIDVSGPEGFKVRLFIDVESHLPLMVSYMDAEPRVVTRTMTRDAGQRGAAPPATVVAPGSSAAGATAAASTHLTPEQRAELDKQMREAEANPPKMVEYRLFFSDYRKVDGVSLPHRIARGLGAKTIEEWDVTTYKINPSFKPDRFKVGS